MKILTNRQWAPRRTAAPFSRLNLMDHAVVTVLCLDVNGPTEKPSGARYPLDDAPLEPSHRIIRIMAGHFKNYHSSAIRVYFFRSGHHHIDPIFAWSCPC